MTYHCVCRKRNTTGDNSGAGTTYPSGEPELILFLLGIASLKHDFSCFLWVRVAKSIASCVVFLTLCPFSFGYCIVSTLNYDYCLSLWYLHPFLSYCICILDIIYIALLNMFVAGD